MLERKFDQLSNFTNTEFRKIHTDLGHLYESVHTRRPLSTQVPVRHSPPSGERNKLHEGDTTPKPIQSKQLSPPSSGHHATADDLPINQKSRTNVKIPAQPAQPTAATTSNNTSKPSYTNQAAKPSRIVGTGTNRTGLKVSTRPRDIYVGCLDPKTEVHQVVDYVYKNLVFTCLANSSAHVGLVISHSKLP